MCIRDRALTSLILDTAYATAISGKMQLASHAPSENRTDGGAGVGSASNGDRTVEPRGGRGGCSEASPAGTAAGLRGGRAGGAPVAGAI